MDYLNYLVKEIHTTIAATVDHRDLPVTCAIDMMDSDDCGLYFLTARGKGFYKRLKDRGYIALTGLKGADTMSSVAVSIRGKVREIGAVRLPDLFEKNPYMAEIYPTEESRKALTVFCIYEGTGEFFDLSVKPIRRESFAFGNVPLIADGYLITDKCTECGVCQAVCPQDCIRSGSPFKIEQDHCLRCGNCYEICPEDAVVLQR